MKNRRTNDVLSSGHKATEAVREKAGIALRVFMAFVLVVTLVPFSTAVAPSNAQAYQSDTEQAADQSTESDTSQSATSGEDASSATEETTTPDAVPSEETTPSEEGSTPEVTTPSENQSSQDSNQAPSPAGDPNAPSSELVTLLDNAQAQGNTPVGVVVRAGDVEEGVQANPGLLMDEHEAWNLLGAYAEARSYEGATQPAANPNFKPSLVNPPTSAVLAAVVSNNAYTGTYVTLDQLTSTDEFNNWKSSSYNICLTWNNMTANIVMTVNEQTFTWPTEVGEYTVAFELSNGKQDADRQSAGVQVTMNVFARSSEDGTGPKPGDDEEQPQAGTNYVVFSDDFTVSVEERDNNTLTDEVLINHGNAVAYQKDNLYTPSGTVVVTDAAKQALKAAQPSDTIAVPFGVQEE